MRLLLFSYCILILTITGFSQTSKLDWVNKVGAKPFKSISKLYYVNDYGVKPDTSFVNTTGIQKAIDDCASKGGGTVSFRAGTYVTGAIFIKSNVQLQIDKDVLILGSTKFEDYPEMDTRIAGIETRWPSALLKESSSVH